jgi:DNA modification methylase
VCIRCRLALADYSENKLKMESVHKIIFRDSQAFESIADETIDLVVTSPPYPMIEMWDEIFSNQDPAIGAAIGDGDGNSAFELMHRLLDNMWGEVFRVLKYGGIACINIGDATRTIRKHFRLYPNHARILSRCIELGFSNLPNIIWRKQTNAPNKFMGSGMLPPGAYVTLEHEYVLILRKGNKRDFKKAGDKLLRNQTAYFWEERNSWFSDVWFGLKGVNQALNHKDIRERSGAFPFELAYRLVNMYSVRGDTVLDPFLGTGTTALAAIASNRNSTGIEIDRSLKPIVLETLTENVIAKCNTYIKQRISNHLRFVEERKQNKGDNAFKYTNEYFGFPVMTRQEIKLLINYLTDCEKTTEGSIRITYCDEPVIDHAELNSLSSLLA